MLQVREQVMMISVCCGYCQLRSQALTGITLGFYPYFQDFRAPSSGGVERSEGTAWAHEHQDEAALDASMHALQQEVELSAAELEALASRQALDMAELNAMKKNMENELKALKQESWKLQMQVDLQGMQVYNVQPLLLFRV